ncbi:hypothetical protein ABK040_004339 [Willaertia magna]
MGLSDSKTIVEEDDTFGSYNNDNFNIVLKKINQSKVLCQKLPTVEDRERFALYLSDTKRLKDRYLSVNSILNNISILDTQVSIKIKFTLIDTLKSETSKNVRHFISPLLDITGQLPNHGIYHSCLTVGPWMIDYTDCGLCIPRKIISKSAFLSVDVAEIRGIPNIESTIDVLSSAIQKWNTKVSYQRKSTRRESALFHDLSLDELEKFSHSNELYDVGNCQDFVDYLLDSLRIKPNFSECLLEFLHQLKVKGKPKQQLKLNEEFCNRFLLINNSSINLKNVLGALNSGNGNNVNNNHCEDNINEHPLLINTSSSFRGNRPKRSKSNATPISSSISNGNIGVHPGSNSGGGSDLKKGRKSEGDVFATNNNQNNRLSCSSPIILQAYHQSEDEANNEVVVKLENYRIRFDNHAQIDLFTNICLIQDPNFRENYSEIYGLLKAFDRAHWMKYQSILSLKNQSIEDKQMVRSVEPLFWTTWSQENNCDQTFRCPFGDPFVETRSFMNLD